MQNQSPFITQKLPLDQEGYTVSFDIHNFDPEDVKQFYDKFGLVIFNNILKQDQVKKSIDELWEDVLEESDNQIKRDNPETWNFQFGLGTFGFVGSKPLVKPQICKNRAHPNVYKAFKSLYEITSSEKLQQPLLALYDRASILRPSKLNPKWATKTIYHFDINPWWWTRKIQPAQNHWRKYNRYNHRFSQWLGEGNYVPKVRNFTKLQGVLAFSNTNPESGGFQSVCGFQNYIKQWCQKTGQHVSIDSCPELVNNMQKVFQRAGSIIIFSRQLPHNIYKNVSQNFRYAQYMRMAPESSLMLTKNERLSRKTQLNKLMHPDTDLTDKIVREVYMLDNLPQSNKKEGKGQQCLMM